MGYRREPETKLISVLKFFCRLNLVTLVTFHFQLYNPKKPQTRREGLLSSSSKGYNYVSTHLISTSCFRSAASSCRTSSLRQCSSIKARDISSCEISICDTLTPLTPAPASPAPMRKSRRHTSVSWGSLPSSVSETSEAEEEERRGVSSEQCDTDLTLLSTLTPPRPSLVLQQSTDSDATTADTGQGVPRRVINISTSQLITLFMTTVSRTPVRCQ